MDIVLKILNSLALDLLAVFVPVGISAYLLVLVIKRKANISPAGKGYFCALKRTGSKKLLLKIKTSTHIGFVGCLAYLSSLIYKHVNIVEKDRLVLEVFLNIISVSLVIWFLYSFVLVVELASKDEL